MTSKKSIDIMKHLIKIKRVIKDSNMGSNTVLSVFETQHPVRNHIHFTKLCFDIHTRMVLRNTHCTRKV